MSLDVYLLMPGEMRKHEPRIFVREDGQTKAISREEWDKRYPDIYPVTFQNDETDEIFTANITHNLGRMAGEAGLFKYLWEPELVCVTKTRELIEPLEAGLSLLLGNPSVYMKYNPVNGWGNYENLVDFVQRYLAACRQYPEADIRVSR